MAHSSHGQHDLAIVHYKAAIALAGDWHPDPNKIDGCTGWQAHEGIALAHEARGELAEAIVVAERSLELLQRETPLRERLAHWRVAQRESRAAPTVEAPASMTIAVHAEIAR
ncbi:MAG: hypothetical protein ACHREM_18175 [Polyangiales bacterium]